MSKPSISFRVVATRTSLGSQEFDAWASRIDSGESNPRFAVRGNTIVFLDL